MSDRKDEDLRVTGTDSAEEDVAAPVPDADPAEDFLGLTDEIIREVTEALSEEDIARVDAALVGLHYADIADLIEQLPPEDRRRYVELRGAQLDPEILPELDEDVRAEVVNDLGLDAVVNALEALNSDDAAYVAETLPDELRDRALGALSARNRVLIEQTLNFPEYSAGRLMQREFVAVPSFWTVGQTIDYLRDDPDLPDNFLDIFVVDPKFRPLGKLPLNRLVRTKRPVRLTEIMDETASPLPIEMDQEEVAFRFRQEDWVSAMVIDQAGRLVGVITIDDVVDVIDEEAEDDLLRLGGLQDDDLYAAVVDTTKARFWWLLVNLGTAVTASLVIGVFEGTIQQVVALAVLMPIVASMGGNAGTQTLTVAVRALATKELTMTNATRIVGKEVLVGLLNGMIFSVATAGVAWLWFGNVQIAFVIALAMVINHIVAALAGILIPLGLDRFKVDPAVASGVFLTTVTDVVGFFAFLGLAALWLL